MAPEGAGGGGAGDDKGAGFTPGAGDPVPTFEFLDPKTKAKLKLPEKLGDVNVKELLGSIIEKSKMDVKQKFEEQYKPILEQVNLLSGKNSELEAAIQKIEDDKLSDSEKALKTIERERNAAATKITEHETRAKTFETMFKETVEENALLSGFSSRADVYQPDQAYKLMKAEFPVEVVDTNEGEGRRKYKVIIKMPNEQGAVEDLDPKTAVERWLAMPEHNHFIKSNLQPGAGSSMNGGRRDVSGTVIYKRSQMQNEKVRKEYALKIASGESVQLVDG